MKKSNSRRVRVVVLGACAICAQTLFIREILGLLTGTELILGLALAAWLFWIGAGGLLGGRYLRTDALFTDRLFSALSVSLTISVPMIVLLIRLGRSVLVDPPGSMPAPGPAVLFSLAVMAPFGFVYGTIYNAASVLMEDDEGGVTKGITSVYILEAAGSVLGAVMLSLLLFSFLTQLESSFAVALIVTGVFLLTSRKGRRLGWCVALSLAMAGFFASPHIDRASLSLVFRGYEVEEIVPSRYAELCVARDSETISVFAGGARLLSYPDPERVGEAVHIPLLAHPSPRKVLMLGGAPGGGLEEARIHPGVEWIDWVELDGKISGAVERSTGIGGMNRRDTENGRAFERGLIGDGRFLLGKNFGYDLIMVNVPDPINLRWNRYFTAEFFRSARRSLAPGGILSVRHSSSENFISERHAAVLGIIDGTLRSIFRYVDVVPGGSVFFISSDSPVDTGEIPVRMKSRGLEDRFLELDNLPFRLSEGRRERLAFALAGSLKMINTDSDPVLVPYELVLYEWRSGSAAVRLIEGMLRLPDWTVPSIILAVVILICLFARGNRAPQAAIFLTGLCSMTVQLIVMLAYQSFSGILYHNIVLLTAIFMAGAAAGALASGKLIRRGAGFLSFCHVLMALIAIIVPAWLVYSGTHSGGSSHGTAGYFILAAVGGILAGVYYRTVVDVAWSGIVSAVPAVFYSWDMFGACAGGLIAGTLLLPLSGMTWTVILVASIHCASALILTRRVVTVDR